MVDWGGSSLQIIIAVIGSGLLVTGLGSLASFINSPLLNIEVTSIDDPHDIGRGYIKDEFGKDHIETFSQGDTYTTYRINLTNIGNSPATDVRLTMTYPGAKVVDSKPVYENENITFTNQTSNSIAVLLPRLSPGILVAVDNNITGNIVTIDDNQYDAYFAYNYDFRRDNLDWVYSHAEPFTIVATYDGGSNVYRYCERSSCEDLVIDRFFNLEILKFYFPIVVAVLLFVIAFRRKRKSMSGSASDILRDIEAVERHLKSNDSRAIFSLSKDDPQGRNLRIFENYDDYDLIDDFYKGLDERDLEISRAYISNDANIINRVLEEQNKKCFSLATTAHSKICWKKFYKFDLILLMPAIILGASFISFICEGVPLMISVTYENTVNTGLFFFITAIVARSIGTYFVFKWILRRTQGSNLSYYVIPALSRRIKFFAYCSVIMGFPTSIIVLLILSYFESFYGYLVGYEIIFCTLLIVIDIGRMLLLTKLVTRDPRTGKIKGNILEITKEK